MEKQEFNFDENSFNELFPFYFTIDADLKIKGFGKSLAKILPSLKINDDFFELFKLKRPSLKAVSFVSLGGIFNQLVVIGTTSEGLELRGQFQKHNDSILFVGSPWFPSLNQVTENRLQHSDFASHDPLVDLLHVLKNQEITTQELKELLTKINNQKKEL